MQTTPDNCMAAAVASWFRCGIDEVPLMEGRDWRVPLQEWLRPRGIGFVSIACSEETFRSEFGAGFQIVAGLSARNRLHAVIYKDGALWHDPHPESNGIKEVEQVDFFYLLHPPAA